MQNTYNTLHGGAVAAVAEAVGMARAAAGDKEMFLGELSTAYLSAALLDVRSTSLPQFLANSMLPVWEFGGWLLVSVSFVTRNYGYVVTDCSRKPLTDM